jgi:hypothetical protein
MDIHPPIGRVDSLKEILTHIFIVTVGILIALSLEGVRENWRQHTIANEARENIHAEMVRNRHKIQVDMESRVKADALLVQILKEMPNLAKKPAELQRRVGQVSFKRFGMALEDSAWNEANYSGALPHMNAEEVRLYADYDLNMKYYLDLTRNSFPVETECKAYVLSHDHYTRAEAATAEEKLIELYFWDVRFDGNGPGILQQMQKILGDSNDKQQVVQAP